MKYRFLAMSERAMPPAQMKVRGRGSCIKLRDDGRRERDVGTRVRRQVADVDNSLALHVGLSVTLSFGWTNGGFPRDAATMILFEILVTAFIYIAARWTGGMSTRTVANLRACPASNRAIPGDSLLGPYCGQRLS